MDAFIFPGQGSQRLGMGAELFDSVPEYRTLEPDIDALLGYSLRELCLADREGRLSKTDYTQPALYVINALHYYAALADGRRPRLLAGHSLGEYNALMAAGVFDFITGLKLVQRRGQLMAQARDGSMAAVIGVPGARISQLLQDNALDGLDVANFNAPKQIVISGPLSEIERAGKVFESAGAEAYVPLPVSAAFHSRYMLKSAEVFAEFLAPFEFKPPQIPVISNVTARPYDSKTSPAAIKELLVKQIHSPVQWTHSVSYLIGRGTERFHEIGPGSVLTRLIDQIRAA